MKRGRRRRQQIRSLLGRKRWHLRRQRSFGLAVCLRSDTISWNRCPKRRFRFSVVDVVSGSPADKAGIKAGDKILAIDGKPTESLNLTEVRGHFRSEPVGKKLRLRVQSGSAVRSIILSFRELV